MEITNQMKVLLISDVHGNLPALDAVLNQASYDRVLFMSDAVDYGHFPFEVYSRLYQIRATRVLGNHDVAASFGIDCQSPPEMHELPLLPEKRSPQKNACQRGQRKHFARKLSERMFLEYDGLRLLMAHGSPSDELYQSISKEAAENLVEPSADLVLLGHTHVLYEVNNGSTWVVNPGSVGMPRDDNPRPLRNIGYSR